MIISFPDARWRDAFVAWMTRTGSADFAESEEASALDGRAEIRVDEDGMTIIGMTIIVKVEREEQARVAIAVLEAYAAGQLRTDQCDELDGAIVKAYQVWEEDAALEFEDEQYSNFGYAGELKNE